jgi:predicted GIY-YIG superfamily endonuclease
MSEPNNSQIGHRWRPAGAITVLDNKITLPTAPDEPGLYRLHFGQDIYYIGESQNVNRRLSDYHTPGQGIESDHRIHNALIRYGKADVEVMTGDEFANKSTRCKREREEIQQARESGKKLLNGGKDSEENLRAKIKYYETEIETLQAKLKNLTSPNHEEDHD